MFTWGEIRVGYYVVITVLVLLFNGTASAVFLGILLALFFEQPFKLFVFRHMTVVQPVRTAKANAAASSTAKAAAVTETKPAPKKASKARAPKAKPKAADADAD